MNVVALTKDNEPEQIIQSVWGEFNECWKIINAGNT
jgi:hypothetical protein